jgi:hypothetical protein
VEDLASDVATFKFDNYPPEVGTPLAGDLAPKQEVSLNEEHPTEELPKHSVVFYFILFSHIAYGRFAAMA